MEPEKTPKEIPPEERDFITTSRTVIGIGIMLVILVVIIHLIHTLKA